MSDLTLNVSRIIHAPVESVFDAWLDPEMLSKFILPMPGMPQPEVENGPIQGGCFTIVMFVGEDKIPHTGQYLEVRRPDKLVFSWLSPFSSDASTVIIDFHEMADGSTNIQLKQVKFIDEQARSDHEAGWSNILEKLNDIFNMSVAV